MLNLAQTQAVVKQARPLDPTQMILNTQNLAAQSIAYAALTDRLGWHSDQANVEMHPTDRVPVFRLDRAALRRNKYGQGWIVEIDGADTALDGTLVAITEQVLEMLAQSSPSTEGEAQPLSTIIFNRQANEYIVRNGSLVGAFPAGDEGRKAAELAALKHDGADAYHAYLELVAQGEDEERARRAARLVQRGHVDVEFGSVTSSDGSHIYSVNGTCECSDFRHRGGPCKHQLALQIVEQMAAEAEQVAQRKFSDRHHGATCENCGQNWRRCGCPSMERQPRNIGESIQQLLGQPMGSTESTPAAVSEADKNRALDKALKGNWREFQPYRTNMGPSYGGYRL